MGATIRTPDACRGASSKEEIENEEKDFEHWHDTGEQATEVAVTRLECGQFAMRSDPGGIAREEPCAAVCRRQRVKEASRQ